LSKRYEVQGDKTHKAKGKGENLIEKCKMKSARCKMENKENGAREKVPGFRIQKSPSGNR